MTKGLSVSIYRSADLGDSTGGGVTSPMRAHTGSAIAVHPDLPELFPPRLGQPVLEIIRHPAGDKYGLIAVPAAFPEGEDGNRLMGPMFGGNFIWTSDSRFRRISPAPIPVHDRFETRDDYLAND